MTDITTGPNDGQALLRLQAAVEAMQIGVTITDTQGKIVYVNPADAAMHGYTVSELIGRSANIFAPVVRRSRLSGEQLRDLGRWVRESVNVRRDGTTFAVRLLSDVIRDREGEPIGIVTICEDITERRALEEQLRHAQKMEALGQLTGGIAHDFNNLLTVVLTHLDLLLDGVPASAQEMRDDIAEIRRAAQRGSALVRKLLAFSRKERIAPVPLDLAAFVTEAHDVLRRVLPESIAIEVRSEAGLPLARADANAVQQMLLNLVTNARDAMPAGGKLTIETCRFELTERFRAEHGWGTPASYVALVVSDTGVGMNEATLQRLFEPFFTTKEPGKGTGLGMAMVYGLVKQHDGFVHVTSAEGQGTTVRLLFPLAVAPHAEPAAAERSAAPIRRGHETILVVEDEASIRRAAQRVLEHHGYRVLVACDGVEALEVCRTQRSEVGLILSDVVMPNMGGRELVARLRAEGATVPIVLTSGYTMREFDEAPPDPSLPFLQKPWTVEELLFKVRETLDRPPVTGAATG
ncbi:MAG TPA: ATP-binding protein [Gemmatimonadales bacterium]|nr:ATP-binding protein [Gemmatimonadales bacterium]